MLRSESGDAMQRRHAMNNGLSNAIPGRGTLPHTTPQASPTIPCSAGNCRRGSDTMRVPPIYTGTLQTTLMTQLRTKSKRQAGPTTSRPPATSSPPPHQRQYMQD
jgi:hypothetical protein